MHPRLVVPLSLCTVSAFVGSALVAPAVAQKPGAEPKAGPAGGDATAARERVPADRVASWNAFLDRRAGGWVAHWNHATGTPRAVFGSGLPIVDWRGNTLQEARRHALAVLKDEAELLGLGDSEFREVIGSRMGRTWSFVFDQYVRGLPVVDGRADVRVSTSGRIAMFGSTAFAVPADFVTVPAFDAETATALAWQTLGQVPTGAAQPAAVAPPRLVLWGDVHAADRAPVHLAWEVAISNVDAAGAGPIGRSYVDARTGAVLHWTNDKHECGFDGCDHAVAAPAAGAVATPAALPLPVNTTVTVRGWTRTGNDAFSALTNAVLPGLVLSVPGIGNVTTDANGQFTINIAAPVSINVGQLDGRHHAAITGANAPSGSFTVNPGVATTIQLLTAGATTNQAAHTTTSWWTDRVNEWARSILGNSAQLATASNVAVTVNIAQTCNAFYGGNSINFYQAGGGCANTAFSTVVAHEWGHGLDDRYGGISQVNGLSEAIGDICGMYLVDSPLLGSGFSSTGVPLRDGNNTRQYPTGGGVHDQGESFMGFAWKLRDRLASTLGNRATAIAITNDIVVGSVAADAVDQQAAVVEVFLADDNDGNLNNGTPNSADLIWACTQHSLPYPGQSVPANDECTSAIPVGNGTWGPYTNTAATTSAPAFACGSGGKDLWFSFSTPLAGTLTATTCSLSAFDTVIQVFSGSCGALVGVGCNDDTCSLQSTVSVPVTSGTYLVRVGGYNSAAGSFSLNISGPSGIPASSVTYGSGCYTTSTAFYELAANTAFDLGNSAMRLQRQAGGFYIASAAGAYVAPTGAATSLPLGDDAVAIVNLAGTFVWPGGSTSSLEVCSNGFVSAATGNGNAWTPAVATWLASPQARWGCWHDFNPSAAGSGQVKFQQIGNVAYVTWDGVYSFNTTDANTWQLQFDLATGNVTYAWSTMVASGNAWLVGYAAPAPNTDLGSRDISAALPGTFRTSAQNLAPLALVGTVPTLGGTLALTTTNYPVSAVLGIQALSLTRNDPGIDLTPFGMGGCLRFTGLEATIVVVPVGGQTVYSMAIPNDPGLQGLPLNSQTYAFAPGANAAGVIASNGVGTIVGY
jgi:hypothetical protein